MSTYQVVEKFVSINGEGRRAGELAAFIRFKGCNLQCSYCDTSWANEPGCESERLTKEEILSWIREAGVKNVTLTGGEPLLRKGMEELWQQGSFLKGSFQGCLKETAADRYCGRGREEWSNAGEYNIKR